MITLTDILSNELINCFVKKNDSKKFILEISKLFPPLYGVILECNLNKIDFIDISFPFHRDLNQFYFFDQDNLNTLPLNILQSESWKGIFNISKLLENPLIMPELKLIWLEFDEALFHKGISTPSIFFNFNNLLFSEIIKTLEVITQSQTKQEIYNNIYNTVNIFPTDLRKGDIGIFLGRDTQFIRFSVIISAAELQEYCYFQKKPLPDNVQYILSKIDKIILRDKIRINLDINEVISIQSIEVKAIPQEWNTVLAILSTYGWCPKHNEEQIINWCANFEQETLYPSKSRNNIPLNNVTLPQFTLRQINHIKFVFSDDEKTAKVYLKESYYWKNDTDKL